MARSERSRLRLPEIAEEVLQDISRVLAAKVGEDFLKTLVRYLAKILGMEYVFVGELSGKKDDKIHTVAVCAQGEIADNFEYDLEHTPCENVVGNQFCIYPSGIQQQFPGDLLLVEMGVESYAGTPLYDTTGRVLGLMVVLDSRPLENPKLAESILQIFSARASIELERKFTAVSLRESEERYRAFVANSSEAIWCIEYRKPLPLHLSVEDQIDWFFRYAYFAECNEAFSRRYGIDNPNDLIGKRPADLPAQSAGRDRGQLRPIFESGHQIHNLETYVQDAEGNPRVFLNNIAGTVENGHITRAWGTQLDITDRKQAEKEREQLIVQLEAKNEELKRFTYTVSHDLKSPLITIKGFLELLKKDAGKGDEKRLEEDIGQITSAANQMQRLLNELLELSRIGRIVNPPEAVPLGELAREAADLVAGQIIRRGVSVKIAPDLPTVVGDRPRLLEVFQNLIENAVKFMGNQTNPTVEVGVRHEGAKAVYYVKDNGIGIDPRYHEKVFGLFDRLDTEGEGTGIGLALVKRIVELHKGLIWVESEGEGHGTTFCFTLP